MHKVAQTSFGLHDTLHTKLFNIHYCVEVVRIVNHRHTVNSTWYDSILRFLSFFSTFAHKVTQIWFVLHETLHTTLFGICYCVEVVRIVSHFHILNITW